MFGPAKGLPKSSAPQGKAKKGNIGWVCLSLPISFSRLYLSESRINLLVSLAINKYPHREHPRLPEEPLMAIKKSELYSSLWKSCDELRGGMDASQYKDGNRITGRPLAIPNSGAPT
jgi:hypothetical protein